MEPVVTSEPKVGITKRAWQGLRQGRIYYWPIRTLVQLGFFLLFAGIALARLIPAFNLARSWVVLPVVVSVKAQGAIGSALDASTLLMSQAIFPWLPIGIMFVVGALLGRFMCGWICTVGFLQDVITSIKGRVDFVQTRRHEYWIRLKYVLVGIVFLMSGTLALALYYGVGADYKQSLGDFAPGVFIAITPDGTLFGTTSITGTLVEVLGNRSSLRSVRSQHWLLAWRCLSAYVDQYSDPHRIHLRSVANPTILVPLHLPGRRHNGSLPEKQLARNAP